MNSQRRTVFLLSLALLTFTTVSRADIPLLKDVTGRDVRPTLVADGDKANVLIFALNDCPISNSYAPAIAALHKQFSSQGVRFFVVYCDADLSAAEAAKHQADYALPCNGVLDPAGTLIKQLKVEVTAEVVVLKADGSVAYHGSIDDQYAAVGRKRTAVHHQYLSDALTDLLAGRPIAVASNEAFGCPLNKDR